jgi:glucuronate isomerase
MLKEMAISADRNYKKVRLRKFGYEKGGDVKTLKNVAGKLDKASKAHAGQSKKLKKIISKYV